MPISAAFIANAMQLQKVIFASAADHPRADLLLAMSARVGPAVLLLSMETALQPWAAALQRCRGAASCYPVGFTSG